MMAVPRVYATDEQTSFARILNLDFHDLIHCERAGRISIFRWEWHGGYPRWRVVEDLSGLVKMHR